MIAETQTKMPEKRIHGTGTLQETNISHLGRRKIIFKYASSGGYVNSLEGIPNEWFTSMAAVGKSSSPMDLSWDGENLWKGEIETFDLK